MRWLFEIIFFIINFNHFLFTKLNYLGILFHQHNNRMAFNDGWPNVFHIRVFMYIKSIVGVLYELNLLIGLCTKLYDNNHLQLLFSRKIIMYIKQLAFSAGFGMFYSLWNHTFRDKFLWFSAILWLNDSSIHSIFIASLMDLVIPSNFLKRLLW